jgi:hypothetical protein
MGCQMQVIRNGSVHFPQNRILCRPICKYQYVQCKAYNKSNMEELSTPDKRDTFAWECQLCFLDFGIKRSFVYAIDWLNHFYQISVY